jgi:cellulose synthase/poly-beta-1,6-N-acetylglucosamine synthase-like glycosyltransferase
VYVFYIVFLLTVNIVIRNNVKVLSQPETRFGIIIPAHNEEVLLPRLLISLNEQDYPSDMFGIIVVADNCSDRTAEVASNFKTCILERNDSKRTGKGYAIKFALDNVEIGQYDAIFIIDADSIAANDAFKHLDQAVKEGKKIIQCYNGVANPDDSWFTRIMDVSRTISNEIFEPAKEKLGFSSHLMGNGMCFRKDVISKYGWDAFSVGEDWEYYASLIKGGERIAFAKDVRVFHRESSSLKQATPQRMRWSSGRFEIARKYGLGLFLSGLAERNFTKISASFPLIFPNPSLGMNITVIGLIVCLFLPTTTSKNVLIVWFCSLMLMHLFIFFAGIMYTKERLKNSLSLFIAPLFLIWKMGIDIFSALGMGRKKWIRTDRKL